MNTYELTIDVSSLSVQQELILIKEYENSSPYNLPWAVFLPFQYNTLQWTRIFSLYAANLNDKGTITMLANTPIDAGKNLVFKNNRFTDIQDGKPGTFGVVNQVRQTIYFGLTQAITINGKIYANSPINITCVPYNQTAEFIPLEYITVFLGSGYEEQRLMTAKVHSEPLMLDFTAAKSIAIVYDQFTGMLVKKNDAYYHT